MNKQRKGKGINPRYFDEYDHAALTEQEWEERKGQAESLADMASNPTNPYYLPKKPKLKDYYISERMIDVFRIGMNREEMRAIRTAAAKTFKSGVKITYEIDWDVINYLNLNGYNDALIDDYMKKNKVI